MPGSINLRLEGHEGVLTPGAFLNAVRYFWGMLRDLDSAISHEEGGSIHWEILSLRKDSPAVVAFAGRSLTERDHLERTETACVVGLRQLSEGERLPDYSDAAVAKALKLARLRQGRRRSRQGALGVIQVFTDRDAVDVGPHTVEGIQSLTEIRYEAVGSIVGNLDSITVHRGSEFRVWEELEGRPVTCRFAPALLGQVKDALGRRVLVFGDVRSNYQGQPTLIDVQGFENYPEDSELPTIEQMSGLVDDFTGGMPLRDYLEDIRHV